MKTFFTLLLSIVFVQLSFSQESGKVVETVKGKVINSASNEPVSYTNIGLEGTFFGTASNAEGDFELKIPAEMVGKNIFFSAVGFVGKKFPVKDLFEREFNVVKIEPQSYDIKDVDVQAQSRVLERILTLANENIPYNYIAGPYNFTAKYERTTSAENITSTIQNADVLIYDHSGYSDPSKLNAYRNLNYSITKPNSNEAYRFSDGTTNIDELLELDWMRTASSVLNPKLLDGFHLTLESEPVINGKNCWVIAFGQETPSLSGSGDFYATKFEGKITIAKDDYSVLELSGHIESPKNNPQGKSLAVKQGADKIFTNVKSNFKLVYENHKPVVINFDKSYDYQGKSIDEKSVLTFIQAQANNLTVLADREYFLGE